MDAIVLSNVATILQIPVSPSADRLDGSSLESADVVAVPDESEPLPKRDKRESNPVAVLLAVVSATVPVGASAKVVAEPKASAKATELVASVPLPSATAGSATPEVATVSKAAAAVVAAVAAAAGVAAVPPSPARMAAIPLDESVVAAIGAAAAT